jgi:predicted membrane GTPase involved in stress response
MQLNEGTAEQSKEKTFTVLINTQDSARYLGFAERTEIENACGKPNRYVIKLNVIRGDSELQIASSRIFTLPKLYENESITEMSSNPLVRLSGIQDLSITKNTDRQSRGKRS